MTAGFMAYCEEKPAVIDRRYSGKVEFRLRTLAAEYQQGKRSGIVLERSAPRDRIEKVDGLLPGVNQRRGRCHAIDVVVLRVQRHGAVEKRRLDGLDDGVLVGRILMRHGERAVARRSEHQAGARVKTVRVGQHPGRYRGDDFPIRVIQHPGHPVAAPRKEPLVLDIDGQPMRQIARRNRPRVQNLELLRMRSWAGLTSLITFSVSGSNIVTQPPWPIVKPCLNSGAKTNPLDPCGMGMVPRSLPLASTTLMNTSRGMNTRCVFCESTSK